MRPIFITLLNIFLLVASAKVAYGQNLIISEIGWAGTEASPYDEWIELFNKGKKKLN